MNDEQNMMENNQADNTESEKTPPAEETYPPAITPGADSTQQHPGEQARKAAGAAGQRLQAWKERLKALARQAVRQAKKLMASARKACGSAAVYIKGKKLEDWKRTAGDFVRKYNLNDPKKWPSGAWLCLLLFLLVVIGLAMAQQPERVRELPKDVAVQVMASASFARDGEVRLKGLEQFSEQEIRESLRFEPAVRFEVEKQKDYALVRMENQRNVAYNGYFQVGGDEDQGKYTTDFELNYPPLTVRIGNGSTVGKTESLELIFSEQVDSRSLADNLKLEPNVRFELSYDLNRVYLTPESEWVTTNNYQVKISADYESKTGKQFAENQVLSFKVPAPAAPSDTYTPYYEEYGFASEEEYEEYMGGASYSSAYINFRSATSSVLGEGNDMSVYFNAEYLDKDVAVLIETYRMDSLDKFQRQGKVFLDKDISLDSLEKLDTNAFFIKEGENVFKVPSFGEGSYILTAAYKDPASKEQVELRTSYFVTPMSVYMQTSARETLVWLNSSRQQTPLSGYEVLFGSGEERTGGVTDQGGMLIIDNSAFSSQSYDSYGNPLSNFIINDPQGNLAYYDRSGLYTDSYNTERYYSYLFLDRTLYKPEDTVCFWGFLKPFRYNSRELPDTVTVRFDSGGLDIELEVPLEESGVFHGEIPLERIKSSQYSIQAEIHFPPAYEDDPGTRHVFETHYVSVREFEKPTYVLDAQADKDYYGPYETVTVTATASFYDGTPLPFFPIEGSFYNNDDNAWVRVGNVKTDASGTASFTFQAAPEGANLSTIKSLQSTQFKVQIASDGERITQMGRYHYFPSDTLIDYSIERQNNNIQLTVRAYKLDTDANTLHALIDRDGYTASSLDNNTLLQVARGEPADVDLNLAVHWSYQDSKSIRHENRQSAPDGGSYLEFNNYYSLDFSEIKPEEPEMKIIQDWETKEKRISLKTKNGVAVIRDLIYLPEGESINFEQPVTVSVEAAYQDGLKNECTAAAYYPDRNAYRDIWGGEEEESEYYESKPEIIQGYSFAITDTVTGESLTPTTSYYRGVELVADQPASFRLQLDSEPVEAAGGRILYSIIQDGLYEQQMVGGSSFNLSYKVGYGTGVRMIAAYYDGTETHYVKQMDLNASTESLKINIDVTPDKAGYRPGDQVNLRVRATDYHGRGVAGNMCVGIVDESIFALSEQEIDVLYSLYEDMLGINNSVSQYCTTYRDEPIPSSMYDGGKYDSGSVEFYDSYRSNFKDTALFLPTTTDTAGNSSITFTLPDNTTSWRITAVEVGNDLRAGDSKSNIISSLPFFCKPVLTTKYINGDDISMLVQGHGTLLKLGDDVSYTVTVTGDGVNETLTGAGKAFQAREFNFGKLPMGSYKVVARAQYSGYSDTVELPVHVIKSNLELVIHKSIPVSDTIDIDAMRYPVTLTLYDESNEPFLTSINSLFGHYCMQANQRLSRFVAKRVIRQNVEGADIPYYIAEGNDYASDMQNSDGGIGYMPGAPSEPLVTTYVLLIAKDQFNQKAMADYYNRQMEILKDAKERAACYLGLAALEQIDAQKLIDLLEQQNMSTDVKAYLVTGLAYLGETEKANELYEKHLEPHLKEMNFPGARTVDWDRDAAAIWIAASRLHREDADALSLYYGKARWRYRTLFECMIYATNYDRPVTQTSYSYLLKGLSHNVNLGLDGMRTMVLSKSDLESLHFQNYPSTLKAVAYYVGEPSEIGLEQSENMSVKKTVEELDDNTYEVTLTMSFEQNAPVGQYDVSDWVPSNSRLYSYDKSDTDVSGESVKFSVTQEGQKLYIAFDNQYQNRNIRFKYRIRQTFQSEAMLDTAYMIHGDSGENCNTEKETFKPAPAKSDLPPIKADAAQTAGPDTPEAIASRESPVSQAAR